MKTLVLCILSAAISAALSGKVVHDRAVRDSVEARERLYDEGLRQTFQFSNGFAYRLEDILIQTHSDGAGWTRVIAGRDGEVPPISLDLTDGSGRSVFERGVVRPQTDIMPGKIFHEAFLSIWSNEPELNLTITIFPGDAERSETISQKVPNPIHHHRLFDLDGASTTTTSIGPFKSEQSTYGENPG